MEHLENGENIYGFLMENTLKISIYMSGTYGKIYIFFYADTKMVWWLGWWKMMETIWVSKNGALKIH